MARHHSLKIPAHKNIYSGSTGRELRIEYALPEYGTTDETGFILFIPGFGGHIDSNVYKKMRDVFADKYNLVTIQCGYFGNEYMQICENFSLKNSFSEIAHYFTYDEMLLLKKDFSQFLPLLSTKSIQVPVIANLQENEESFADMGIMQAIDHIYAIESVIARLEDQNLLFNRKKVIGFGDSHGSYLLHLCNRLSPHLFSVIIDNSAWVVPSYLFGNRLLRQRLGQAVLPTTFSYYASNRLKDKEALHIKNLYKNFDNGAYIYSFIGTNDNLVDLDEKADVLASVAYVEHEVIDESKVDGKAFKSTNHGLDADFLELTEYVFNKNSVHINPNPKLHTYEINSCNVNINVNYTGKLPLYFVDGI